MEEKKEIGMEKLIELLNEYEKSGLNEFELEKCEELWYCKWNGRIFRGNWENGNELTPYELCSKQYGFIKWLVENDKIDLDNQAMQYAKSDLSKFFIEWKDENGMSDDYAMLLMLLAIQDEPIRFLCNLLK